MATEIKGERASDPFFHGEGDLSMPQALAPRKHSALAVWGKLRTKKPEMRRNETRAECN